MAADEVTRIARVEVKDTGTIDVIDSDGELAFEDVTPAEAGVLIDQLTWAANSAAAAPDA